MSACGRVSWFVFFAVAFLFGSCSFFSSETKTADDGGSTSTGGSTGGEVSSGVCPSASATRLAEGSVSSNLSESAWTSSVAVANGPVVSSPVLSLNLSARNQAKITGYTIATSLSPEPSLHGGEGEPGWSSLDIPTTDLSMEVTYTVSGGDGAKAVYVWFKDECGDVSPAASVSVTLDTGRPSGSLTLASGAATTSSLSVAVKIAGSGTTPIVGYSLSEAPSGISWLPLDPSTAPVIDTAFTLSATAGTHTVYGWLKTESGMVSAVFSDTIDLVITAPTAGITINEGALFTRARTASVSVSGLGPNPINQYALTASPSPPWGGGDGEAVTVLSPATSFSLTAISFDLSSGDGLKTVYLYIRDATGTTASASATITLDTTPPTGALVLDGGAKLTVDAVVSAAITGTDNIGVTGYLLSSGATIPSPSMGEGQGEGGSQWTPVASTKNLTLTTDLTLTGTLKGLKTEDLWLKDGAGNINTASISDGIEMLRIVTARTPNSDTGQYTSIAVNSKGTAYIASHSGPPYNAIYVSHIGPDGKWRGCSPDPWDFRNPTNLGEGTAIAIDGSDNLHIAYRDSTNNSLKYATRGPTETGMCPLGDWTTETVEGGGNEPSIALDPQNRVHILHYGGTYGGTLRYATRLSGEWSAETIQEGKSYTSRNDLIIDSLGVLHGAAFNYSDLILEYLRKGSGDWTVTNLSNGLGPSVALGTDDKPNFAYVGNNKEYARPFGNGFVSEVAAKPSCNCDKLVIDASGYAHIILDDTCKASTRHLMYASNITGTWKTMTLDASNGVGSWCDLAIDRNDRLHISYYDATNTDLKYATTAD